MKRAVLFATMSFLVAACAETASEFPALEIPSGSTVEVECSGDRKARLHHISNIPVYIVCRDEADLQNLALLNVQVFDAEDPVGKYRSERLSVFVAIGVSPGSRCSIEFIPTGGKWRDQKWFGGFYSACNGETYDLAGRQIQPGPYSPNDFPKYLGNLIVPKYRYVAENIIEFL